LTRASIFLNNPQGVDGRVIQVKTRFALLPAMTMG
jgi:hypothetical protein